MLLTHTYKMFVFGFLLSLEFFPKAPKNKFFLAEKNTAFEAVNTCNNHHKIWTQLTKPWSHTNFQFLRWYVFPIFSSMCV